VAVTVELRIDITAYKAEGSRQNAAQTPSFESIISVYQVGHNVAYIYVHVGAIWARINGVRVNTYWSPRIRVSYNTYMYSILAYTASDKALQRLGTD